MNEVVKFQQVEEKIITVRTQQVILDSDVAELYDVETKRINEAVGNNPDKFPDGYILGLTGDEWKNLKSKFSTSSWGGKNKLPNAFTEKGLYMLATILKSPRATQTTLAIVETFAKMRELARTVAEISETREEPKQKTLMQKSGEIIADILGDDLQVTDTETSIEINFALMKFRHTVKQRRPGA
jgi:hypothetical protein